MFSGMFKKPSLQTKVNSHQKEEVRAAEADGYHFYQDEELGITLCCNEWFPGSEYMLVSVAHMGKDEKKFRSMAGKWVALNKHDNGEYIAVRSAIIDGKYLNQNWLDSFILTLI